MSRCLVSIDFILIMNLMPLIKFITRDTNDLSLAWSNENYRVFKQQKALKLMKYGGVLPIMLQVGKLRNQVFHKAWPSSGK